MGRGVRITLTESNVEGRGWLWSVSTHGGPKERWRSCGNGLAKSATLALHAAHAVVATEVDPQCAADGRCVLCGMRPRAITTADRCGCTRDEIVAYHRTRIG